MSSVLLIITILLGGVMGAWLAFKICGSYGAYSSRESVALAKVLAPVGFFGVQFLTAKLLGAPTIYQVVCTALAITS